jgi:hypothetical protein
VARRASDHAEVRNRLPIVSRTEGQHLVPLKTFIKNNASKWRRLLCSVRKFNISNKNNNPGGLPPYSGEGVCAPQWPLESYAGGSVISW